MIFYDELYVQRKIINKIQPFPYVTCCSCSPAMSMAATARSPPVVIPRPLIPIVLVVPLVRPVASRVAVVRPPAPPVVRAVARPAPRLVADGSRPSRSFPRPFF